MYTIKGYQWHRYFRVQFSYLGAMMVFWLVLYLYLLSLSISENIAPEKMKFQPSQIGIKWCLRINVKQVNGGYKSVADMLSWTTIDIWLKDKKHKKAALISIFWRWLGSLLFVEIIVIYVVAKLFRAAAVDDLGEASWLKTPLQCQLGFVYKGLVLWKTALQPQTVPCTF